MQGPSRAYRSLILWLLVATALVVVLFVSWTRSSVPTASVAWSVSPIKIIVGPGETTQRTVILRSSETLSNARIEAGPDLASLVTISPMTPASITAGEPFAITLLVSPGINERLRTLEGTIRVRVGMDTLADPLSVVVNVTRSVYAVSDLIGTTYPPFPPDMFKESGGTIGVEIPAMHEVAWVTTPNGPMLWLSRRAGMLGREVQWTITDVLMIPWLEPGRSLIYGLCGTVRPGVVRPTDQSALALDEEIVAIVLVTDAPMRTHLERAWRANRGTGRFESISTVGLACLKEG